MFYKNKFRILILVIAALLFDAAGFAQTPRGQNGKTPLYQNPVFDSDFPDPTVIRAADNYFYAHATQAVVNGKPHHIQAARSKHLLNWERPPDALPEKPVWAKRDKLNFRF